MNIRNLSILTVTACLFALMIPTGVLAGGWAVITLDDLPANPVAGQPLRVGFTVLQHGRTPMEDLTPTVSLEHRGNGGSVVVSALPEGQPGHYTAELVFPVEGNWDWSIQAFTMDQPMPALQVSPPMQALPAVDPPSTVSLPVLFGAIGLACLGGALLLLLRTQPRWALALLVAGLLLGGAGFAFAASQTPGSSQTPVGDLPQAEIGQRLFVSKGCTTCHAHRQVESDRDGAIFVDTGPDLSDFSADPEYLIRWLADPASIRAQTEMPDLGLEQAEIDALTAFLNAE